MPGVLGEGARDGRGGNTTHPSDVAAASAFVGSLRKRRRVYFTLQDLQDAIGTRDQSRVHSAIKPLLDSGEIEPLKSAKGNGSTTAPLFEKYRIVAPPTRRHDLTRLHPRLLATAYLERNPKTCDTWWNDLLSLSDWLSRPEGAHEATLRERCWEVFGNEKAFDSSGLRSCVKNASGMDARELLDVLGEVPEELPFVIRAHVSEIAEVVVSENRDPYLAIRRALLKGTSTLFGQRVDAVVWGRGDVVRQAGGSALTQTLESMHAKGDAHVWYWGDIDREGLSILSALASAGLVRPLTEAYEAMLETSATRPPRTSPDERNHAIPDIGGLFDQDTGKHMVAIMEQGLLLPQESVSSHAIGEAMR